MTRRRRPAGAKVRSLTGLSLRSLRARPLRSVLSAGAIVLGVGMVFGVLLLVGTIHSSFNNLFSSIYGNTDVVVSGEHSIGSLPESTINRVREVQGVESASGSIYSVFRLVDEHGKVDRSRSAQLYTVGIDYAQPEPSDAQVVQGRKPVAGRGQIEVARDWADRQGLQVGDPVRLSTPTGIVALRVSGLYEFKGGLDMGGYGTASMPVADARRVMDKPGIWDEIAVIAAPGTSVDSLRQRLDSSLGRGVEVATPKQKSAEYEDQLASLDIVLYFFSGIALFVGAFLILNSFSMTVLQRMREIGTLRALGASDRRVARSILAEAVLLGIVGSILGLALGAGLAVLLLKGMESMGMPVSTIDYSAGAAIGAVITGLVATVAGAAWPAVRAARIPPIRALTGGSGPRKALTARRALVGTVLFVPSMLVGGYAWFGTESQNPVVGVIGAFSTMVMFVALVLLAPFVVLPLVRAGARPLRALMPAEGRLASDAAQANPSRTAATAATLLVSLSVVVVNATIAESFVGSVKSEFNKRFARDLTIQPLGYQEYGPPQAGLSRQLRERIAAMPETGAVAQRRSIYLPDLPGGGSQGTVVAYDPRQYDRVENLDYEGAPKAEILNGMAAGGVVPSKAYAKAQGLEVGDTLRLDGPAGVRNARVVGFVDTLEAGGQSLEISLGTMAAVYGVTNDSQLIVKAASPDLRQALDNRVNALLERDYPGFEALSNADVKKNVTDAINQQFSFFNAIVAIAALVGVLGIVNTLMMSVLERTREIGVLRALGASRWRVRRTMGDESLLISLAGTLSGIGAGLLVGVLWVFGMAQTKFTGMTLHLPVTMLIGLAVAGVVIGVVAAVLPARRAARLDPLAALRYE
ncbi:MAG: ABC transporter permease [Solirubrobacterales bacterium]|nr:FtsX-like permease family protein [Solirubrobacterales bacterium]